MPYGSRSRSWSHRGGIGHRGPTLSDSLLRLDEVALRLSVSRRTVNRLVAQGRIRVVYPSPGCPRVTERELAAFRASLRAA